LWKTEQSLEGRSQLLTELKRRNLFPSEFTLQWETDGGIYPYTDDPNFVSRLLHKAEFADTKSPPFDASVNPCSKGPDFEITPVQRFVANFLHPRTPYMSILLYHGVGVGKTCAAIGAAEAYLDSYPKRKAIIVAPKNIQSGFLRTIFDIDNLVLGKGDAANSMNGCTGTTYLRLTGCLYERDKDLIQKRVNRAINRRYEIFGYIEFANYIRRVINVQYVGDTETVIQRQAELLRKTFGYRLLIIDEAHNLRDVEGTGKQQEDLDTVEEEKGENKGGKLLTPYLLQLLKYTTGLKLCLMTATPMFNSVFEIVFLLRLLVLNDKKTDALIQVDKLLEQDGSLTEGSEEILRPLANAYISFMRGENPNSFPIRLFPEGTQRISVETYPNLLLSRSSIQRLVPEGDKLGMSRLPIYASSAPEDSLYTQILTTLTNVKVTSGGTGYQVIDSLLQAGNCVFPLDGDAAPESYVGNTGFDEIFHQGERGSVRADNASWLTLDNLASYSPKLATILRSIKHMEGVGFVYSRFVKVGAFLLALALEANGYTPYGRQGGFLANGIQSEGGRQCALCPNREKRHPPGLHGGFVPAKYVLLTGDPTLSPNNAAAIAAARAEHNLEGGSIKVILGSQIAGEGLDLRFIREIHILDAWFHLNKTEQIIGRGIRFCSHSLLDSTRRNTTVFLHAIVFPDGSRETADLYCYRNALQKAILVGKVSRQLKRFAMDCNLRSHVTVLKGLTPRIQIDSQGTERIGDDGQGISIDDMDYTVLCDWMECEYTCEPEVEIEVGKIDDSTYDTFSAQYRESILQKRIQALFEKQPYYTYENFKNQLAKTGAPAIAIDMAIQSIVQNRLFRVHSGNQEGYILYKNNYFLFQPETYRDLKIPLALRIADVPVKRDQYSPSTLALEHRPEDSDEEGPMTQQSSASLWNLLVRWVTSVIHTNQTTISIELEREIEVLTGDFRQQRDVYMNKLAMIIYLASKVTDHRVYEQIVLEYLWDEWIPPLEQARLLATGEPLYTELADGQLLEEGRVRAIRYVDLATDTIQYMCENGLPCSKGIVEYFEGLPKQKDPSKGLVANPSTTGSLYGFLVPKRGAIIFKTLEPQVKLRAISGQECAIVTTKSHWYDKLLHIGTLLRTHGKPTLDLDEGHLRTTTDIINSTRGCTVLDLVLRYLDKLRFLGKKWFYRPIDAYMSGHRGLVNQTTKVVSKSAVKPPTVVKSQKVVRLSAQPMAEALPLAPSVDEEEPPPLIRIEENGPLPAREAPEAPAEPVVAEPVQTVVAESRPIPVATGTTASSARKRPVRAVFTQNTTE